MTADLPRSHASATTARPTSSMPCAPGSKPTAEAPPLPSSTPTARLIAFLRTDGCPLPSIANAVNKAFTAARERTESAAIGEASRQDGFPITNFGDLRYTGWGGGVPIVHDGHVVGAVGVSGLPEPEDIELARLGSEAPFSPPV